MCQVSLKPYEPETRNQKLETRNQKPAPWHLAQRVNYSLHDEAGHSDSRIGGEPGLFCA
jgi:hypothetical protein